MSKLGNHAIVIGSGIAGLLTARVLADYFDQVTIVERDKLPKTAQARRGVSQSLQPHILLAQGYRILETLFPNIEKELQAAGAIPIDWGQEFYHFHPQKGGWNATLDSASSLLSFTCTRPVLETTIRQQVSQLTNVSFQQQCRVLGLLGNASNTKVKGIRLYCFDDQTREELYGEFVVDASGRGSQLPHWLEQLGYQSPPRTVINPLLGYATRRYRIPADQQPPGKVTLIEHYPPNSTRLGYLARVEEGEWIATLGGYGHDYPPLDEKGFLAFAKSLPSPTFYEAIREAEPTTPINAHRATANRLYRYEDINLPNGVAALGDAVCAPCPVYGQGMTMSALSSMVLQNWLQQQTTKDSQQRLIAANFQKQLAKSNASAWSMAVQQDSRFTTTQGAIQSSLLSRLLSNYTNWIARRAHQDGKLHTYFMEIAQMIRSPIAFFHPWVFFQAIKQQAKSK
jgi:2-polyprenyl-6-methoxyphenol hydroxylase-like FAD-dependent oxidoreductase